MLRQVAVLLALLTTPVLAQVTERPIVTADNDHWFRLGEPIHFGGQLYYPAGPDVFFNGNVMVRTGHYDGVPLYVDATLEPYSVIFVPMSRGLMRPYQRRASPIQEIRAPSTSAPPVELDTTTIPGLIPRLDAVPAPVGTAGRMVAQSSADAAAPLTPSPSADPAPAPVATLRRPEGNVGLWIPYLGAKWISAGPAIQAGTVALRQVGDYAGFPVYMHADRQDVIYVPTRPGILAPYRRTE
jgi:hypothetical protein